MARVLVRLKREHGVLQEGRRVMLPAGSLVEVSEHTLRTFADRMELVERDPFPAAADDNTGGQQTTANGPQLVQEDDGEAGEGQSQEATTGEPEGEQDAGSEVASPEDSEGGSEDNSEGSGNADAPGDTQPQEPKAQPAEEYQPPAYDIVQKPGGWYGIMVDGEEVAKGRKDEIKTKLIELGLAQE